MLYIQQAASISPQDSILHEDFISIRNPVDGKLHAKEPDYKGIPPGVFRRMGKAVRMGVGAALELIRPNQVLNGIILGTANGGMEDCMKFLKQIIEYDEGMLTPGSFVQGIPNAIAGQLGLLTANHGYNITHVHKGLAFENAVIDAFMLLSENPQNHYLLGAVDEISSFNYNIELLSGNFKKTELKAAEFYQAGSTGSIAGEGAAMFLVNGQKKNALAGITGIHTLHTRDEKLVKQEIEKIINQYLSGQDAVDLFISGENGDSRLLKFYESAESVFSKDLPVIRYKHLCGEYYTSTAYALWLTCELMQGSGISSHLMKSKSSHQKIRHALIYNNYAGEQHSFIIIENLKPEKWQG